MRKNYVVRKGDTLRSISQRYYRRDYFWWFLALVNSKQKDSYVLKEDEKIRVPNRYDIAFPISLLFTVVAIIITITQWVK